MLRGKIIITLILALVVLGGCVQIKSPQKLLDCPPQQQGCVSYKWQGIPVDTSEAYQRVANFYYHFENLKRVNSPEDEWALSFIDNRKAIITFQDGNQQRIMMMRISDYKTASVESGIGSPFEGSIGSMSIKDKKVVFAASPVPDNPDILLGNSDLYTADLQGNILVNVKNMGDSVNANPASWESQPAFSPDKNVVFFVSDGHALMGTQIYYTIKLPDGNWSKPISCGDSVNSSCDELTPFVTTDGKTLLFSSCGHETVGGYDIFSSSISDEFWRLAKIGDIKTLKSRNDLFGGAVNLRPPLNIKYDELFPSSLGDYNDILFYSSNQTAGFVSIVLRKGGFDLYVRKKEIPRKTQDFQRKDIAMDLNINLNLDENKLREANIKIPQKYSLEGKVYNDKTKRVVPYADLVIRKVQSDQTKTKEVIPETNEIELTSLGSDLFYDSYKMKSDTSGDYKVELEKGKEYEVTAQADNLFFDAFKVRVEKDDTTSVIRKDFYVPENFTLRINFPTKVYNNPYKYTIDSNGVETSNLWQDEINNVAKNLIISLDKIKKVILTGHTDDVGTIENNQKLGLDRVQFVIDELLKRGIPMDKLEGRSFGKLEPLEPRPGEAVPLYRKRLRRVELLKVLK